MYTNTKKNKKLESRLREVEKANEAHKKAIEALKRQIKKEQDMAAKTIELYKASEEFKDEVSESSKDAYDYAFSQYRNLIKKLYPEVESPRSLQRWPSRWT